MTRVPVTFDPQGITVWVEPGVSILDAARRAGVPIAAPCGGRGICGSCGVRVLDGVLEPVGADERAALTRAPADIRLSCRARVSGPVTVRPLALDQAQATSTAGSPTGALAVGVDLGTTTVAARAVDIATGREWGYSVVANRQSAYGADVLSRIGAALGGASSELERLAAESVAAAVEGACGEAMDRVGRITIAANPAMAGLLAGVDVGSLAAHPFEVPAGLETVGEGARVRELLPSGAAVNLVPAVAGFVGGDALAASFAHGLPGSERPRLLVDVGTNAEVVLAARGSLWVASAAAGPAFEGGGLTSGGPAVPGAVTRVRVVGDAVELETIGGVEPLWLSGSGLVSAVAELVRSSHVRPDGAFDEQGPLSARFSRDDMGVLRVRLDDAGTIAVSQLDIRSLQLAKAAVRVAIEAVLSASWSKTAGVTETLVAGAFGGALVAQDLADIGMIPQGLAPSVRAVGNAALDGATMLALDPEAQHALEEVAPSVTHVDLAADPGFNAALMTAVELRRFDR